MWEFFGWTPPLELRARLSMGLCRRPDNIGSLPVAPGDNQDRASSLEKATNIFMLVDLHTGRCHCWSTGGLG